MQVLKSEIPDLFLKTLVTLHIVCLYIYAVLQYHDARILPLLSQYIDFLLCDIQMPIKPFLDTASKL